MVPNLTHKGFQLMRKPDAAELELADFIRRTEETLDEPGQRQLESAMAYVNGYTKPVKLDLETVLRKARLHDSLTQK
jgi:hypothetical protein